MSGRAQCLSGPGSRAPHKVSETAQSPIHSRPQSYAASSFLPITLIDAGTCPCSSFAFFLHALFQQKTTASKRLLLSPGTVTATVQTRLIRRRHCWNSLQCWPGLSSHAQGAFSQEALSKSFPIRVPLECGTKVGGVPVSLRRKLPVPERMQITQLPGRPGKEPFYGQDLPHGTQVSRGQG